MKLDYKVLWFEDHINDVQGQHEDLKDFLEANGFELKVDFQKDSSNIAVLTQSADAFNEYDLVLLDWNLGEKSDSGEKLAKIIRRNFYTEIIFYSSVDKETLIGILATEKVDGVFCVNRDNNFVEDVKEVITIGIKKFQHPNAIRGLFMAETADFDATILDCLSAHLNKHPSDERLAGLKSILGYVTEKTRENLDQFGKKLSNGDFPGFLRHRAFFASHRLAILIKNLRKNGDHFGDYLATLLLYQQEIIELRNELAHVKIEEKNGRAVLVGSEQEFDHAALVRLRKTLMKHGENLRRLKTFLE